MDERVVADLTDKEVDAICAGLKQNAAKLRFLRRLGLTVQRKPNGRALVNRLHYNTVRGGSHAPPQGAADGGPVWRVTG